MGRFSRCLGIGFILLSGALLLGCSPKSPAERVAGIRGLYSARLNGFILEEEPMVTEVPELEAVEIEEPDGEEMEIESELVGELIETPVTEKVRLDILIQHRSDVRLPGITVDVTMVDSNEQQKGHWLVWFDTSEVTKATVTQFTHILEDVGYEEGDGFFAEIRHPIPEEERSDYREFSEAL